MAAPLQQGKGSEEELVIIPIFGREAEMNCRAGSSTSSLPARNQWSLLWKIPVGLWIEFFTLLYKISEISTFKALCVLWHQFSPSSSSGPVPSNLSSSNRDVKERGKAFINPPLITNIKFY